MVPNSRTGPAGLVLTPGASAGRDQAQLVAIDEAVSASGIVVERVDFPYRLAGRRRPDAVPVLLETVQRSAAALAERLGVAPSAVALGGRSMGGRICSMAVAAGLPAAALVLVSYPLHPPGRPEKLRTEHFPSISVPTLFVSGDRDAFGSPEELREHANAIPGEVTMEWLPGDHSLRRRDAEVGRVVAEFLASLSSRAPRRSRR